MIHAKLYDDDLVRHHALDPLAQRWRVRVLDPDAPGGGYDLRMPLFEAVRLQKGDAHEEGGALRALNRLMDKLNAEEWD